MAKQKAPRAETMQLLYEIIKESTSDPAADIVAMGEALTKMGTCLKGVSPADAKAIVKSVAELHSIKVA